EQLQRVFDVHGGLEVAAELVVFVAAQAGAAGGVLVLERHVAAVAHGAPQDQVGAGEVAAGADVGRAHVPVGEVRGEPGQGPLVGDGEPVAAGDPVPVGDPIELDDGLGRHIPAL